MSDCAEPSERAKNISSSSHLALGEGRRMPCLICGVSFEQSSTRGRRQIYCGRKCNRRACEIRRSIAKQAARQASAHPCKQCGGPVEVKTRGPVPKVCSSFCDEVLRGMRRPAPLPPMVCALPDCVRIFVPVHDHQRCCSERHGKMLYNRESRADGRQKTDPWNDRRRDSYHRRRALKKGATSGGPVRLAEVAMRDRRRCHLCGSSVDLARVWPDPMSPSLDHLVPLTRGGPHAPENVRLAHLRCNVAKGNRGGGEQLLLIG